MKMEIDAARLLLHPSGHGGFGPEFTGEIPLVETVPGAPDASVEAIDITGAAIRQHGRPVYYGTVPTTCQRGGFPGQDRIHVRGEAPDHRARDRHGPREGTLPDELASRPR
jgi:hypothetical protein